jgi:hypothetical protein
MDTTQIHTNAVVSASHVNNTITYFITVVKVKVKLPCALIEHHAMKVYWGSGGIALLIL